MCNVSTISFLILFKHLLPYFVLYTLSSESSCSGVCMWSCYANWFCVMWKALAYRAFRSILSTCRVTPRRQVAWNPTWKLRKHSWSTESCSFLWRSSTSFKIKVEGHVDSPEQFALGPLICRCFLGADGKLLSLDDMQAGCFGMCPGNYKLLDFDPAWAENTTSCFVGTSSREFHTSSRVSPSR